MTAGRDAVLATVRKVIKEISKKPPFKSMLDQEGIPIAVLGQAFRLRVEEMDYPQLGFPKLRDLVRYLCTGTDWQIARSAAGGTTDYLIRRNRLKHLDGWEAHPDLSDSEIHGEDYYRVILPKGEPMIRIADSSSLRALVTCLSENPPRGIPLAAAVESVAESLQGKVPAESIRSGLLSLINVGAFVREPENMPLLEQILTLRDTWTNPVDAYNQVREAAREKILRMLGKIDDAIFNLIL
ncbi:MAG: OST-HTH/LOTUS domain-containing protein [Verrucomicrobiota bacterium]